MNILSRPYPQRIAGDLRGWSFDFDTHVLDLSLHAVSDSLQAPTEIFTARTRHYAKGMEVLLDGRSVFKVTPESVQQKNGDVSIRFDTNSEILKIAPRSKPTHLELRPLS